MKNKFLVCFELLKVFIYLVPVFVGCFIWFAVEAFGENIALTVFITFMLLGLPLAYLTLSIFWGCQVIEITEEGISKSLFGKRLKYFKWEEISEVKGSGKIAAPSISFFRNRNENSFLYRFTKREKIFFAGSIRKTEILKHYAPEYIIKKVFSKDNEYADDTATLKCGGITLPPKSVTVNNKFYACLYVIPLAALIFISCVCVFFIGVAVSGFPEPLYLLILMILLLLVLPSVLLILGLFVGLQMIEITEQGIALLLFGKRLKYLKWEEISNAKIQSENKGDKLTVSFYKVKENSKRNRKERISFTYDCTDISRMMILKKFAPDYILDKLNRNEG